MLIKCHPTIFICLFVVFFHYTVHETFSRENSYVVPFQVYSVFDCFLEKYSGTISSQLCCISNMYKATTECRKSKEGLRKNKCVIRMTLSVSVSM